MGISSIIILSLSLLLTYRGAERFGWNILFTLPILFFTILPSWYPTSPFVSVFFITFQFSVFVIFEKPKILLSYFVFYNVNLLIFVTLLFYVYPQNINLDFRPLIIDITIAIAFIYITLRFYIQTRFINNQNLQIEENKFKAVFENNPIGIIVTQLDGNYEKLINTSYVNNLGYSAGELENRKISSYTHPDDIDTHQDQFKKLLEGEIDHLTVNKKYIHKMGNIIWATTIVSLVRDEKGKPIFSIAMLLDVTEQKKQEQKIENLIEKLKVLNSELESKIKQRTADLSVANEELQRSNQDLEQFAYAASHDLKEPLRMISSFVQILEKKYRDKIDDQGKEYIKFTVEGVTRMSDLINSLLQYSRVGRKESKLRPTKINNLIELKLMDLRQVVEEKNAQINILFLPETMICEPVQIGLVFYNLINNGLKFNTNENPIINIKGEERENDYLFTIQDNGIGIEDKFKNQVFEIFKRLHSREKYEGTGIGLALCRKIIHRHEGDIWFESELNEGTTFYFTIKKDLVSSE